jgi:hypothetical protein
MTRLIWAILLTIMLLPLSFTSNVKAQEHNMLSDADKEAGWKLLFDGKTLLGWVNRGGAANWMVENGELTGEKLGRGPGYIGTFNEYTNYELHVEFNQDAGHNSGVFLRGPQNPMSGVNQYNFYEINIADTHSSGFITGSIVNLHKYEVMPQTEGKWNTLDITAKGRDISVMLNGEESAKIKDRGHYTGVIVLQAFGEGKIRFRNVKIREME